MHKKPEPYKWTRADRLKYDSLVEQARGEMPGKADYEIEDYAMWLWLRWKGSTDLYYLGSEIIGLKDARDAKSGRYRLDSKMHKRMAEEMQRDEDTLQLYPRLHMKSTWVKIYCLFLIIRNPLVRIGFWSRTTKLVRKELRHIKQMCRLPILRELWPEVFVDKWEKDTQDELLMHRDTSIGDAPQEAQIEVWGIDSTVTGHHYDYQLYDDIINEQSVTTAEQIEKVSTWWQMVQAIKELTAVEKFTGTRYHQHDIYGEIIDSGVFEKDNIVVRACLTNNGTKPLYSFFTLKDIERLKRRMGDNFWPQMMNEPVPSSRRLFVGPYPLYRPEQMPLNIEYYITVDPAATVSKTSDHTAIAVAAIEKSYRGILYYVEVEQYKEHPDRVAEILVDKIVKYRPKKVGIELGLQQALQYIIDIKIQAKEREIKDYIRPTFVEINTRLSGVKNKADKFSRTIASFIRDNRCAFLENMKPLFRQMNMYNPNSDKNDDDMIDACSMMMQTIEKFSAAHWRNVKDIVGNVDLSWDQMRAAQKAKTREDRKSWGYPFAS